MIIYNYMPKTNEIIGPIDAEESTTEPGTFIIPQFSTAIIPPEFTEGKVAVFDIAADIWVIQTDLRGQTAYSKIDGSEVIIETIGELDAGLTLVARPSEAHFWVDGKWKLDRTVQVANIQKQIKLKRDNLQETNGFLVSNKWFHSDQKSRTQYLGLLQMTTIPAGLQWKTMDKSFISMTSELVLAILSEAAVSDIRIFEQAEFHVAGVAAAKDPAKYDWSVWPMGFVA
jgi:hypothetical protein